MSRPGCRTVHPDAFRGRENGGNRNCCCSGSVQAHTASPRGLGVSGPTFRIDLLRDVGPFTPTRFAVGGTVGNIALRPPYSYHRFSSGTRSKRSYNAPPLLLGDSV